MPNCEAPQCNERASKILSVGSLGRVEKLCERHVAEAARNLEPHLIPFHLTGIDAPFTGEESLGERVAVLDAKSRDLLAALENAKHENARLQELLMARLEEQNERLSDELQAMQEKNDELQAQLPSHAEHDDGPVTRVD